MSNKPAARMGDDLIHSSMLADIASIVVEGAAYAAIGAAVGVAAAAAAPLAGAGAVAAGLATVGSSCVLSGIIGGLLANMAGVTDDIASAASGVGDFLFPPSVSGKITSGSSNVLTNNKMAARAAAQLLPPAVTVPESQSPMSFLDYGSELLGSVGQIANSFWQPTVASAVANARPTQQDTVLCDKHSGPQFMAEGSSTVLINGQPAIRAGDRSTCEATVADTVSPDVIIGGGSVVVREIKSGKTPGLALAMMLLPLLRGRPGAVLRNMPCMVAGAVGGMAADMLVNATFSSSNPVHAATGVKVLNDDNDLDFSLPGRFPLRWQRNYNSRSTLEGLFGRGWSTVFDTRLEVNGEECLWFDEFGRELRFTLPAENEPLYSPADGLIFRRGPGGELAIADADGSVWRLYRPVRSEPSQLKLASLSDEYGNMLEIDYDETGRPVRIHDASCAIDLQLIYQDLRFPQRITALHHFDGTTHWPLMTYVYSESGQLGQVTDAAGVTTRTFTYNDEGLMSSHRLPGGMLSEYRWQRFDDWRVVATRTSAGDSTTITYDLAAGLTTVLHDDDTRHQHFWNEQSLITRYIDERGETWRFDWDRDQQLTQTTDPLGNKTTFRYDDGGDLVGEEDALGNVRTTQWLETRALPASILEADGSATRFIYDEHYGLAKILAAEGISEQFERDESGLVIRRTDAAGGISNYEYNEAGQIIAATDCSGFTTRYRYHPLGWLLTEIAPDGEETHYEYDAAGRPTALQRPEGWEEKLHWSRNGLPVAHQAADGRQSQFRYDDAGRLIATRNPEGQEVQREYDSRSRLTGLINENGERYGFKWGAGSLLLEERGLDGVATRYGYDAGGRVAERTFAAGTTSAFSHLFRYDARGRVIARRSPDGETRFDYSAAGQLLRAAFHPALDGEHVTAAPEQALDFTYDAQGRLIKETGEQGAVEYEWDALGNRTGTTLPDGRKLRNFYYGSGHLLNIALDGLPVTGFSRDNLHRETSRTQGGLISRVSYDRLGRLRQRDVFTGTRQRPAPREWSRRWDYDYRNNLIREAHNDNPFTWRQWQYDAAGRLLKQDGGLPDHEQWRWDAASNPLDAGTNAVPHNRVTQLHGSEYRYDVHGRTVEKKKDGERWRFSYDGEHRLSEVVREGRHGVQTYVSFRYDPLGRRISKTSRTVRKDERPGRARTTHFVWEGLRLLQEIQDAIPLTYVYADQSSYAPLARIDGLTDPEIFWYHCHPNGTPERLTDEEGRLRWHGHNGAWGKLLREERLNGPGFAQNLRMQGQYLDRETGLHYNLFRYYDPDTGRFTQQDPIGLAGGLNLYQYAPNALGWVDPLGLSGEDIFIHYTDQKGLEGIMNTKVLNPNASGKVYITDLLMSPEDVSRNLLINNKDHIGRGEYAVVFKSDELQARNIQQSSELEYIHSGKLKLNNVIYAGKNPYSIVADHPYEKRLTMLQEQINSRGNRCGR
ncbi:RHS repeat-associated core domain-containing protein [Pantoea sp. CCBC3-3-1]|uniref:RHS repeat-associated core domain-containing protein n=1 Tax=Pantoea sp. CCBC3-3-1 TaxID=2490851 RepID=UPI0011BE89CE|nr:RHS repeat-associated core domain-containing protein [Pantoea sp. CCBC3-3-1]